MNSESYRDIVPLLEREIEREEEQYIIALREGKEFWQLKEIRARITDYKKTVQKILSYDKEQKPA